MTREEKRRYYRRTRIDARLANSTRAEAWDELDDREEELRQIARDYGIAAELRARQEY